MTKMLALMLIPLGIVWALCAPSCGTRAGGVRNARQAYGELGELANPAVDLDYTACFWVTMPQLIERPRLVPSPIGLVMKGSLISASG
jgi:hypothetical protein